MRKASLIFVLFLLLPPASAADKARCGLDAFGNPVCLDKDGVLTNAPPKAVAAELLDEQRERDAAAKGEKTQSDSAPRQVKPRCGVDPFGNTVCR